MTTHSTSGTRRLRATIIGLGLDGLDEPHRVITSEQCLLVGGSARTQAELLETMLRLEAELDRLGMHLSHVPPAKLAEIAWRIDSPELEQIALRMESGLARRGRSFEESSAAELTALASSSED